MRHRQPYGVDGPGKAWGSAEDIPCSYPPQLLMVRLSTLRDHQSMKKHPREVSDGALSLRILRCLLSASRLSYQDAPRRASVSLNSEEPCYAGMMQRPSAWDVGTLGPPRQQSHRMSLSRLDNWPSTTRICYTCIPRSNRTSQMSKAFFNVGGA